MNLPQSAIEELAVLRRSSWKFVVLGTVLMLVGLLAIGSAQYATDFAVLLFGWLLVFAGVIEVVHAFAVRLHRGFALHLLSAALYLIVGVFILEHPTRAAVTLTLLLAAAFFVGGALRILLAVVDRFPGWPWILLSGIVDVVLGVLILSEWPESGLWVIGLFIGIDLLFQGWAWVILGLSTRSLPTSPVANPE